MRPGSKPNSDEDKKRAGTFTPARARPAPKLTASEPKMPAVLPERAQEVWQRIVPEMAKAKMLAEIDLDVLVVYCTKMGQFYEDMGASFRAADITQLRMLMCELGLTPSARLSTPPLDEPDSGWTDSSGKVVDISKLLKLDVTPNGKSDTAS